MGSSPAIAFPTSSSEALLSPPPVDLVPASASGFTSGVDVKEALDHPTIFRVLLFPFNAFTTALYGFPHMSSSTVPISLLYAASLVLQMAVFSIFLAALYSSCRVLTFFARFLQLVPMALNSFLLLLIASVRSLTMSSIYQSFPCLPFFVLGCHTLDLLTIF